MDGWAYESRFTQSYMYGTMFYSNALLITDYAIHLKPVESNKHTANKNLRVHIIIILYFPDYSNVYMQHKSMSKDTPLILQDSLAIHTRHFRFFFASTSEVLLSFN